MKNSDMPAMPTPFAVGASGDVYGGGEGECGLTKREHFAGLAMQGICASGPTISNSLIVTESLRLADALLAELDRNQGK